MMARASGTIDSSRFANDCGLKFGIPIILVTPLIIFKRFDFAPAYSKRNDSMNSLCGPVSVGDEMRHTEHLVDGLFNCHGELK